MHRTTSRKENIQDSEKDNTKGNTNTLKKNDKKFSSKRLLFKRIKKVDYARNKVELRTFYKSDLYLKYQLLISFRVVNFLHDEGKPKVPKFNL